MLKLITWNIQSARTAAGGADTGAVAAALDRFSDFDILCLQEVACGLPARDGRPTGDQFRELAARLPGYRAVTCLALDRPTPWRGGGGLPGGEGREGGHGGARRPGGGGGEGAGTRGERLGSMVFSRHPVLQVLRHSLPWPADPDVPGMPRCALEATLDTADGPLRVVCVHLEYFSSLQRLAQVGQLRTLQHEAVRHARHQRHPRSTADASGAFTPVPRALPAVFLGDFNMLPESSEYALLQAPFTDGTPALRDCWRLAHPNAPHAPTVGLHDTSPGAGAPCTFDFAFASVDLAPRVRSMTVCEAPTGSGHQPLLPELA